MKRYSWLLLGLLPLLAGCPKRGADNPDYQGVRDRAEKASQDVDKQ